jgi:hypothetical protein
MKAKFFYFKDIRERNTLRKARFIAIGATEFSPVAS